ncbi:MAG: transcription initiation factor IIB family protein [Halanaeroarchaeum sp.]
MTDGNDAERTRVREAAEADEESTSERRGSREDEDGEKERRRPERDERELVCPECGGRLEVDEERGETVCSACGLVVEEGEIDRGPGCRSCEQDEGEEKSRVGAPVTKMMHDEGLSTTIGWRNRDASGRQLSARQRARMQRLRTWNERFRTRDSKERNLKQALGEIDRMASALGLSTSVRETAAVIYRRALDEDLLPGRSIEGVATATLYAAARQSSNPRSLDEVTTVSRVERDEIARTYRYVDRELGLEIEPADPVQYVSRIVSELDLSEGVERRARELLRTAADTGRTSGKSPVGLAAAAVYASALLRGESVTQSEVSEVANVSEVTIRNRYQELLEIQNETSKGDDG